ncbi:MAG: GNAT family N-acetyltransferase [Ilumatobacteraceae bacterium]
MNVFVRRANLDDTLTLSSLETEARNQLTKFRGGERLGLGVSLVGDRWNERIDSNEWLVLVAGFDNEALGYLCVNFAAPSGAPLIEVVYVTDGARQLGLGDGLVTAAIAECRRRNASEIDAYALPGDRETKNLFERSGLTARLLIASKNIEE